MASTQPRRFSLCSSVELSCDHVWSGPIPTELRAWASLVPTWGMQLIFFFFSPTEAFGTAMWFSKLSFHKMRSLLHCVWGLTSSSSQNVLSARSFQVEISNASLHWWHCCCNGTSTGSRKVLGSLSWQGLCLPSVPSAV